jgi:hypothetical protein
MIVEQPVLPASPGRAYDLFLYATLAMCIIRLWLVPLPSSMWVDEMGTAFVVQHGASDPSLRAAPQVADSIYYVLPKIAASIAGTSEYSYRFFSVLAMAGALLAIAKLAARLIDERASWLAVFGCLASRSFNYQAADARPYALGTFVLAVALLLLVQWQDSKRLRDGLFFALAASLLWWVHLIFWPFYILFAVYAGFRVWQSKQKGGWLQLGVIFCLIGAATFPVVLRAIALLHEAGAHVVVPPPQLSDLLTELKIGMITGACTGALLLTRYLGWKTAPVSIPAASIVLIVGWWLIDPLALYGFSRITGNSVFLARYLYLALPGVTFTALLVVMLVLPPERWKQSGMVLGAAVLIFGGHWNHLWLTHQKSDWRSASQALRVWTAGQDVPVICPSPFIEARPPVWRPEYPISGFLYANLAYYPIDGRVYPFPFEASPEAEASARSLTANTLAHASRFAIYGGDRNVRFWREWFAARPELQNWQNEIAGTFGDVQIAVFESRSSVAAVESTKATRPAPPDSPVRTVSRYP